MKRQSGFTLIELVVAVVIVAILATIAIPSYREYVMRGHRRAAQAAAMDIVTKQHQYFVANRVYASLAELGYALPPEVDEHYDLAIDPVAGPPPGFIVSLTATGSQAADGDLSITSEGVKSGKW